MPNTSQQISVPARALAALSMLKKLTHHYMLIRCMFINLLYADGERRLIQLEAAGLGPEFDEAHEQLAVMNRQFEDAGTMLQMMAMDIARKIATEESTLAAFPGMAEEVRELKTTRRNQASQ